LQTYCPHKWQNRRNHLTSVRSPHLTSDTSSQSWPPSEHLSSLLTRQSWQQILSLRP
jgi:hypothetical protein